MKYSEYKKNIIWMTRIICCLFIVYFSTMINVFALTDDATQDDEIVRTITKINELRENYNIPKLLFDQYLNKTAQTHNLYMQYNNSYTSIEESGKLYFRGRYPWDRASYNGYMNKYVFELLNKNVINYYNGLAQLLQNPYSRYSILDPLYTNLGMHTEGEYSTYLFGGTNRTKSYALIYPYNKQSSIPIIFENKFTINPYSQLSLTDTITGIPVTYTVYSSEGKIVDYKNIEAKLTNVQTNEVVSTKVITSLTDRNLTNTIMILPIEPYNLGTTYKITLSGEVYFDRQVTFDGINYTIKQSIDYTGTFTTIQDDSISIQNSFVTREKFVEDIIKNSNLAIQDSLEIIFPDVKTISPNYKYIYTAFLNKIVIGYNDGLYRPAANLTREQAYTILIRLYEKQSGVIQLSEKDRLLEFSDVKDISSYALEPIYKAKKLGILIDNQYDFLPKTYISITEFKQIMERYNKK